MSATTQRAVAVMRMHLVDRITLFLLPLSVVAASFVINLVIWTMVPADSRSTGGAASLYVFVLIAALFAVSRGLPFALGMGASRRAFTMGTGLTGLVLAGILGTVYLVLQEVERATDGWWLGGSFFDFPWFTGSALVVRWLLFVMSIAATFLLGTWLSAAYARWGTVSMAVGAPLAVLVLGAAAVVITWREWWSELGGWFGGLTPLTTTGWTALLAVVMAAATWLTLRRVRAS